MIRKLDYPLGKSVEIEDLPRLREICLVHGYDVDNKDLIDSWSSYSDERSANWLILPEDRTWTKAQSIFHYMQDKYMSKDFGFGFINEIAKLITKKDEKELFGYWNKYQNDRSRNR